MSKHLRPVIVGLAAGVATAYCLASITNRFWWVVIPTIVITIAATVGYMAWSGRYH